MHRALETKLVKCLRSLMLRTYAKSRRMPRCSISLRSAIAA